MFNAGSSRCSHNLQTSRSARRGRAQMHFSRQTEQLRRFTRSIVSLASQYVSQRLRCACIVLIEPIIGAICHCLLKLEQRSFGEQFSFRIVTMINLHQSLIYGTARFQPNVSPFTLARLQRDFPALAFQVVRSDISCPAATATLRLSSSRSGTTK